MGGARSEATPVYRSSYRSAGPTALETPKPPRSLYVSDVELTVPVLWPTEAPAANTAETFCTRSGCPPFGQTTNHRSVGPQRGLPRTADRNAIQMRPRISAPTDWAQVEPAS